MSKKLYIWTTPTFEIKGWYKIGESTRVLSRGKELDGTSSPEKGDILYSWDSQGHTDKEFHKFIESKGIDKTRLDKNREWFIIPGGPKEIKTLWNEFVCGIARPDNYKMREEQQDCCDKAVECLSNGSKQYLINGKMRFGKTFTTYQIIKQLAGI
jgi:type II restriction enzyme